MPASNNGPGAKILEELALDWGEFIGCARVVRQEPLA
jgi:hypothetical protein